MGRKQTKSGRGTEPEISVKSYDGNYPNLCSGRLVLTVDGTDWDFGKHSLSSGGSVSFYDKWSEEVTSGEWSVREDAWPEAFPHEWRDAALEEINRSVTHGCCGGCV